MASVLAALVAVVFLDLPGDTQLTAELQNSAHAYVFALIAWVLIRLLQTAAGNVSHPYILAFGICAFLGAGTEALQFTIGRDASLHDLGRDLLGTAAALCALHGIHQRKFRVTFWIAGATFCALAIAPLGWSVAAYIHRSHEFPSLVAFDSPLDLYFIEIRATPRRPTLVNTDNLKGLYVPLNVSQWPGLEVVEPYPDWRGYSQLAVHLFNPSRQPLSLTLRVNDRRHTNSFDDRLNASIDLPAGGTLIWRIPLSEVEQAPATRRMDLSQISNLQIFAVHAMPGTAFVIEKIWLE